MRPILSYLVLFCVVGAAVADDDYKNKVYPCPRLTPAPKIDGAVNDACWQKAPVVSGFTWYNKPILVTAQTSFRVGYDDTYLYFGIHCDEPHAKKLTPVAAGRDSKQCFHGETIELFVDPNHDQTHYFQLAVNLANSFYDSVHTDPSWNSATKTATKLLADGWELEMAIPWKDLGVKAVKPGLVVGFNICRDRYAGGAREWSNWSQTKSNFHDPMRFAHLVLDGTPEMLGGMAAEFRKGGRRGPIVIFSQGAAASKAYLAMARETLARFDTLLAELAAEGKQERSAAARAEVASRLAAARKQVAPYRAKIQGAKSLDAAQWTRMDIEMNALEVRLNALIWDARLAALLKDI